MQRALTLVIICCLLSGISVSAQKINKRLTLDEVIHIAQDQSLQAILAKHRFRGSYWQYRTFKAKYLPHLTLSSTIFNFDRSIKQNLSYENREWLRE